MTPADRPATEPRTPTGRALLARGTDDISMYEHEWRATILAIEAEAAQGAAPLDVDVLANIIRQEDGDHSLGAGALAERILARWGAAPRHEWCEHGIRDDANCSRCPEGAAPRAEGLDVERLATIFYAAFGYYLPGSPDQWEWIAAEYLASRPSDERVPESEEPR